MVSRRSQNVTWHVNCLSCYFMTQYFDQPLSCCGLPLNLKVLIRNFLNYVIRWDLNLRPLLRYLMLFFLFHCNLYCSWNPKADQGWSEHGAKQYNLMRSSLPLPMASRFMASVCDCFLSLGLWVRISPWHERLSLLILMCCQVEVSVTGWSLVQRSASKHGVYVCDLKTWTLRRPRKRRAVEV